jgi:hypothetical protein
MKISRFYKLGKIIRKAALFHIFANLFNVYLNRRWLDSLITL